MSNADRNFEFVVTLRPKGRPLEVFAQTVEAKDSTEAKKVALEKDSTLESIREDCTTARWRREIGHEILSEKEVVISGQKCLEVETPYAVILVGPEDVYASISKVRREAYYWGIWASKKYGRLRGHAAVWFETQQHRFGRKGTVKGGAKTTFQVCGAEIYYQATTGDTYREKGERERAAFRAREEEGLKKLQPRIDAGEFDPKNFESYNEASRAYGKAKNELGIYNGTYFGNLYPRPAA
jgi:hypothetical protein